MPVDIPMDILSYYNIVTILQTSIVNNDTTMNK